MIAFGRPKGWAKALGKSKTLCLASLRGARSTVEEFGWVAPPREAAGPQLRRETCRLKVPEMCHLRIKERWEAPELHAPQPVGRMSRLLRSEHGPPAYSRAARLVRAGHSPSSARRGL